MCVYTDIAKDLALWEEGRLSRSTSSPQTNLVALDHQGNFKVTQGQDSEPNLSGKDIQLQLQRNKSSTLSSNNRPQVSCVTSSRLQPPNTHINMSSVLPTQANRSVNPNTFLQSPLSPNNPGNMEGIINMQKSRSVLSKNQFGRTVSTPSRRLLETSGDSLGNVIQRNSVSEVRFLEILHTYKLAIQCSFLFCC